MMYLRNNALIYTKLKHALETENQLWDFCQIISQLYLSLSPI